MPSKSEQKKRRDRVLRVLDTSIQFLGPAGGSCGFPPAQAALGSACALLTMIRVRSHRLPAKSSQPTFIQDTMVNENDFLDLAQTCAEVCEALKQGLNG